LGRGDVGKREEERKGVGEMKEKGGRKREGEGERRERKEKRGGKGGILRSCDLFLGKTLLVCF